MPSYDEQAPKIVGFTDGNIKLLRAVDRPSRAGYSSLMRWFHFHRVRPAAIALAWLVMIASPAHAVSPADAILFLRFDSNNPVLKLHHGARLAPGGFGKVLEFDSPIQYAELPFSRRLNGLRSMTIGGWFYPRRSGEQYFFSRGLPTTAPLGERMFPPQTDWVNFVLGTDQRGFLLGTINGNGRMPFPYVTVNAVGFDAWSQLAVVKDARGFEKIYLNGALIHTDEHASAGGKIWPFRDSKPGQPIRLMMPLGGLVGEVWIVARELSPKEIRQDFVEKRIHYRPALASEPVLLREMDAHPAAGLWKQPITRENWGAERTRILRGVEQVLGPSPKKRVPLDPTILSETDCGDYTRRKVSIHVQAGDRMPAYLLIPKKRAGRVPAIICFYGTTQGAGKDRTVGLSGAKPGAPPEPNESFALDMVRAGFVAFAGDYLRDGERINPGRRPYDTTDFYKKFPRWSCVGKDAWDNSRAVDYLQTLDFVDPDKIGMTGHSYGGHSTIFAAALDPRIKVVVANGPVSDFIHHGMHWGVPKGASNSQSLPGMRPYVLDQTRPAPVTFYEFTALIAPRPLLVGQAAGERRPFEEENYAAVHAVYEALGACDRVRYHWYAGDHDYPPEARQAAVAWFRKWFFQ